MKLYHGTNITLTKLNVGSWVTTDRAVAIEFANEKVCHDGGSPKTYELELDESQIEWDIISMSCGVEDDRGVTLTPVNCHKSLETTHKPKLI